VPAPGGERDPHPDPLIAERDGAPAYAVVTLPYLPRALEDHQLTDVARPIVEADGTIMVRLLLADPVTGRRRRVRVRLVQELRSEPVSSYEPEEPAPSDHRGSTLLALLVGFGLGVGMAWLFVS